MEILLDGFILNCRSLPEKNLSLVVATACHDQHISLPRKVVELVFNVDELHSTDWEDMQSARKVCISVDPVAIVIRQSRSVKHFGVAA
jgi:hypothetical protein